MKPDEIIPYLGLPWISGQRDCWLFFRELQEKFYGRTVPVVDVDVMNIRDVIHKVETESHEHWTQISKPEDGCAVLMSRARYPVHIGMWVELDGGKVLHCAQGMGVVFQNRQALFFDGWTGITYWRFKS
jgi:hypothetical protein